MCASSGCSTIGASTPSTSSRIADSSGRSRRGSRRSSSVAGAGTHVVCPAVRRTLQLAAIGTAAGGFSGLFGVGGGTVVVPLLVLWLGYGEREATGTSLAAIVLIATVGAAFQGAYGNLRVGDGLLVGLPAVAGVIGGTWLQQRIPQRRLSLIFAALMAAVAIGLLV